MNLRSFFLQSSYYHSTYLSRARICRWPSTLTYKRNYILGGSCSFSGTEN